MNSRFAWPTIFASVTLSLAALVVGLLDSPGAGFGAELGDVMGACRADVLAAAAGAGKTFVEIESAGTRPNGAPYTKYRAGQGAGFVPFAAGLGEANACAVAIEAVHLNWPPAAGVYEVLIVSHDDVAGYQLSLIGAVDSDGFASVSSPVVTSCSAPCGLGPEPAP